jgi:hypothetical protein
MPGVVFLPDGTKARGSFQTVVFASSEIIAWEIAMMSEVWEPLPFSVDNAQIFPREPVIHGKHQTR